MLSLKFIDRYKISFLINNWSIDQAPPLLLLAYHLLTTPAYPDKTVRDAVRDGLRDVVWDTVRDGYTDLVPVYNDLTAGCCTLLRLRLF